MVGLGLGRAARLERLVVQLAGVMTARSLYAPGHPSVDRALRWKSAPTPCLENNA